MEEDMNYVKLGQLHGIMRNKNSNHDHIMISRIKKSIESLLKTGFDVNYGVPVDSLFGKSKPEFTGYTLLHFAVQYQSDQIINLLLNYKIDVTCKALNGFTPLRLAFELMKNLQMTADYKKNKSYKIVHRLLQTHIDFNIKTNPKCRHNISHFHIACMIGIEFANFFIEAGVDINETVNIDSSIFPGFSPLHFAIQYGHLELVKKLLECGANVNQPDDHNKTPLSLLVDCNMKINDGLRIFQEKSKLKLKFELLKKNDQIMKVLINKIGTNYINDSGLTFIHAICTSQDLIYVKNFLSKEANINKPVKFDAPSWPGYTPLHFSARCNLETFMLLLKNGANLEAKDANGITALDLCTERYTPAEISNILKTKTGKYIQFGKKTSLADVFLAMNSEDNFDNFLSKIEVDACIPLDSPIWPGFTLLHLSVLMSQTKKKYNCKFFYYKNCLWDKNIDACSDLTFLSEKCLTKNCDWLFKDANGMTPLHLAFHLNKSKDLKQFLSNFGSQYSWTMSEENQSHIHEAIAADCPELVTKLLKNGWNQNWVLQKDKIWYCNDVSQKPINLKAGSTLLHIAALVEANNIILECSKISIEIGILDADGLTPAQLGFLHLKSKETLSNLLSIPCAQQINSTTTNNLSHLHIACYTGNIKAAEKLLQVATSINEPIVCNSTDLYAKTLIKYAGYTPLHFAVQFSCYKIVSLLIQKGANILIKNARGLNSLHQALQIPKSCNIKRAIIKKIIETKHFQDDFRITKLHLACFLNDQNLIQKLIAAGENVNCQIDLKSPVFPGDTPFHILFKYSSQETSEHINLKHFDLSLKNADNLTVLHILLNNDSNKSNYSQGKIKRDILYNQDINKFCSHNHTNNEGISLLHISACFGKIDYVERFLQTGADVNKPIDHFSYFWAGDSLLHLAVRDKNLELILLLLQHGADISAEDINGYTILHYLVLTNFTPTDIDDIISRSPITVDFYNCDAFGKSVFQIFLECGKDSIIMLQWIIDKYNGNIDLLTQPFDQMLKIGERKPRSDVIQWLLKNKSHLSLEDTHGRNTLSIIIRSFKNTRLHLLPRGSFEWYIKIFEALINAGCKLDHKDNDGKTALHHAVSLSTDLGASLLLAIGANINIQDNAGYVPSYYVRERSLTSLFESYISRMTYAGLYLNTTNQNYFASFTRNGPLASRAQILLELNQMSRTPIECKNKIEILKVRQILSEELVLNFSKIPYLKRDVIKNYLDGNKLVEQFPSWRGVFKLQRRRIMARVNLLKYASVSYHNVTLLPLECTELIVQHLSDEKLKQLIELCIEFLNKKSKC